MKVVLFCGGMGMRMREFSDSIPKPMVHIGTRPILWHLMKYYAHFGYRDFVLCLGWQGNAIKDFFLNYDECASNDFVLSSGGQQITHLSSDIQDWTITFADTGIHSSIGQRLRAAKKYIPAGEEFLANYTDGLTDVFLPDVLGYHREHNAVATFTSVRPTQSFHTVETDQEGLVTLVAQIEKRDVWMNGGFFVFSPEIFDYIQEGEDLIEQPFQRLISEGRLRTYRHPGFWACMDTYKEKQQLDEMFMTGNMPWQVWKGNGSSESVAIPSEVRAPVPK